MLSKSLRVRSPSRRSLHQRRRREISLRAAQDATTPPTSLANALPPNADGADTSSGTDLRHLPHAIDGTGSPQSVIGFPMPLPDGHSLPDFTRLSRANTAGAVPRLELRSCIGGGPAARHGSPHAGMAATRLSDDSDRARSSSTPWTLCDRSLVAARRHELPARFFTEKGVPRERGGLDRPASQLKDRRQSPTSLVSRASHQVARSQCEVLIPIGFQQTSPGGAWRPRPRRRRVRAAPRRSSRSSIAQVHLLRRRRRRRCRPARTRSASAKA